MRIRTTIGLGIAGVAGAIAIGGTAWAATGGGATPAEPAAPVVSEQPSTGPGSGTGWDCPEKQQRSGSGTESGETAL
jgi:hypothetical protein